MMWGDGSQRVDKAVICAARSEMVACCVASCAASALRLVTSGEVGAVC